jgi:hypothetical protein
MEDFGIPIDAAVDPVIVQPGDRFYRDGYNKETRSYNVKRFSETEIKTFVTNRTIGAGSSGIPGWEKHIAEHSRWSREYPCCAVWNSPPILVVETEIRELRKALIATQVSSSY